MRAAFIAAGLALALCAGGSATSAAGQGLLGQNRAYAPYIGELEPFAANWFASAFRFYKAAFIDNGRVFDPQNRNITHSEGQGYGMMLALLGDDRAEFDKIWRFAKNNMQRDDGLFAWRYEPRVGVTDWNNATDGDLFIATALTLAAYRWKMPHYLDDAHRIADTMGRKLIIDYGGYTLLLPGEWAKPSRHRDRAVINMSYFIPLTFPVMSALAPQYPWAKVREDGYRILDDLTHAPSDWTEIGPDGQPKPARGFPQQFSYDAVRIPLYLLQFGQYHGKTAEALNEVWGPGSDYTFSFDVTTLDPYDRFWGKSYELVNDIMECRRSGAPVGYDTLNVEMRNYFDSSLHLMALGALYALYPECYPSPS